MTTSGTYDFTMVRNDIINKAARKLRVYSASEPMTEEMTQNFNQSLNSMVKSWQADGLHLWCKTEGVLFLQLAQQSYKLGGSTADHATNAADLAQTTVTTAAISGASSIIVESAAGITSGYFLGIELADGSLQWTTVSGAPAGTTVTLASPLTDAVNEAAFVFCYQTALVMPRRIIDARRRNASNIDIPIQILERPDYFYQANKASQSYTNQIYYDRQLSPGVLYVWPVAQTVTDTVRFTYERPIQTFDDPENTPDLPEEWLDALIYNLAYKLAPEYSYPLNERALLKIDAEELKARVMAFDREFGSVFFQPDTSRGGGFMSGGYAR